jgi:hypothetical protein
VPSPSSYFSSSNLILWLAAVVAVFSGPYNMRRLLKLHPASVRTDVADVYVSVVRPRPDSLRLSYIVTGNINGISMPPAAAATRADQLWEHTCFEAFIRASSGAGYYEFNFSPSTQWAAYMFSGYRSRMEMATEICEPAIEIRSSPHRYTLQAALELGSLPSLSHKSPWRLGLSAVIENTSGRKAYWALAHPPGKPDFHHEDCFAYELSPTVQS